MYDAGDAPQAALTDEAGNRAPAVQVHIKSALIPKDDVTRTDRMRDRAGFIWDGLCVVTGGLAGGCGTNGPIPITVTGVVTLDGKPLPATVVEFEQPRGMNMATGVTGEDGCFKVTTYKLGAGATPGKHRVQVSCRVNPSPGETRWIPPKEYTSFESSRLRVDVTPKQNTFTFELSSRGPAGTK